MVTDSAPKGGGKRSVACSLNVRYDFLQNLFQETGSPGSDHDGDEHVGHDEDHEGVPQDVKHHRHVDVGQRQLPQGRGGEDSWYGNLLSFEKIHIISHKFIDFGNIELPV